MAVFRNLRSPVAIACFLLTAAVGFGLDQWTKRAAFADLCDGVRVSDGIAEVVEPRTVRFIPGLLNFDVTPNQGAVFGIGQGRRTLFITVSVAAILFIGYLFLTGDDRHLFYPIVLGMLLAGVLGNLYDRVELGYVRDMIHALPHWPRLFPYIFNVADSLLCVGVALMALHSIVFGPHPHGRQPSRQTDPPSAPL